MTPGCAAILLCRVIHVVQVHRALYSGMHPVAVKMLTDPGIRNPDEDTLRSFRWAGPAMACTYYE
jgi:hypothetical protein